MKNARSRVNLKRKSHNEKKKLRTEYVHNSICSSKMTMVIFKVVKFDYLSRRTADK